MFQLLVSYDERKTWSLIHKTYKEDGYMECLAKTTDLNDVDWMIVQVRRDHIKPEKFVIGN